MMATEIGTIKGTQNIPFMFVDDLAEKGSGRDEPETSSSEPTPVYAA